MADAVCTVLLGVPGTPGAVDCASVALRSPSPAPLSPLTTSLYVRPPTSPPSVVPVALPLYATVVTAPDTPSLRYTRYVLTAAPVVMLGALHASVMLVVFCATLDTLEMAGAAVDCEITALRLPSPLVLKALTTNEYSRPPASPDTTPPVLLDLEPSYATVSSVVPPSPSLRYTRYPVTAASPSFVGALHASVTLPVVCAVLRRPAAAAGEVDTRSDALRSPSPPALNALTANTYVRPPLSPVTVPPVIVDARPSYATVVTAPPAPSLRYTT